MKDERPNGKPQFDARFLNTPMGRARAGRAIVWDPRGTMNSGGSQRLENIDITQAMAKKYAAMTNKAAESAFFAEYYDGVNTMGDDGQNAQQDLMLAQMSKLQKKQMDKVPAAPPRTTRIYVCTLRAAPSASGLDRCPLVICPPLSRVVAPPTGLSHATCMRPVQQSSPAYATHPARLRRQDGDGKLSTAELELQGFAFGMHNKSGSDGLISAVHGDVSADATFVPLEARGGANAKI